MAGRPAGYSDEENDSQDYDYYDNTNNYENEVLPVSEDPESSKDPWSRLVFQSVKTSQNITSMCNNVDQIAEQSKYEYNVKSISSFLKCLEEGNIDLLKEVWFKDSHDEIAISSDEPKDKQPKKTMQNGKNSHLNYAFNELGGARPIFVACRYGRPEVVKLLISLGASIVPDAYDGLTPLMSVCGSESSCDINVATDFDSRLLECAEILINDGQVDINAKQNQQITALMLAAKRGHLEIVKLLISKGVVLDAMDSQRWTALCFAVDANHGHVVRALLEAGADPDIATQEGTVAADLANTSGDSMLLDILLKFSKNRSKLFSSEFLKDTDSSKSNDPMNNGTNTLEYKKCSELDFVLLGIDAKEYLPHFEAHGVALEHFLALNEKDLEKIGVEKVGIRKKMLSAIAEIHKRNWEKTSLPVIKTVDKQKGIYYTCPDAVLMIANIADHFKFIRANVEHLRKNICDCPDLLSIGQEIASLSDLDKRLQASKTSVKATSAEIDRLQAVLDRFSNDPRFHPVDLISNKSAEKSSYYTQTKIVISGVTFLGSLWCLYKYIANARA